MSIEQTEVKTRIWWRVATQTVVAGKVSTFVDWYYGPTAEFACGLAAEDARRYGLPADAMFAARLADGLHGSRRDGVCTWRRAHECRKGCRLVCLKLSP